MAISNSKKYFILFLISFAATFLVHKNVFDSHLRHGMVEDGSVSQYAGDLLDHRSISEKYSAVLEIDGRVNGRYRPAYYIYETIPFVLTVIKNGDYVFGLTTNSIKNKINGDVRFHMIFLLVTVSLSFFFGSVIVYKLTQSFLYACLCPLTVLFSPTLVRNITYNDTAEVPQLICFAIYFALFFLGEDLVGKNKLKRLSFVMVLAVPVISFLYLTKETTIVLLPALLIYSVLRYFLNYSTCNERQTYFTIYYRLVHLFLNGLLAFWVLMQVKNLKGGYSNHYEFKSVEQMWETFVEYTNILISYPPTIYIPLFSLAVILQILIFQKKLNLGVYQQEKINNSFWVAVLLISTAIGIVLLNLPWEFVGERYMLPAAYLFAVAGCVLLGSISSYICEGKKIVRILLFFTIVWFSYPAASMEIARVSQSYDVEFGHHKVVDTITQTIISGARLKNSRYLVLLDVGKMSSSLWMQTARIINIEGRLNVTVQGQKYPQERMYLRRFENAVDVLIVPSDGDGYSDDFDIIYCALSSESQEHTEKVEKLKILTSKYLSQDILPIMINGTKTHELLEFIKIK